LKFLKETGDLKGEEGKGTNEQDDEQEVIVSDLGEEVEIIDQDSKSKGPGISRIETIQEVDNEAEEEEESSPGSSIKKSRP